MQQHNILQQHINLPRAHNPQPFFLYHFSSKALSDVSFQHRFPLSPNFIGDLLRFYHLWCHEHQQVQFCHPNGHRHHKLYLEILEKQKHFKLSGHSISNLGIHAFGNLSQMKTRLRNDLSLILSFFEPKESDYSDYSATFVDSASTSAGFSDHSLSYLYSDR